MLYRILSITFFILYFGHGSLYGLEIPIRVSSETISIPAPDNFVEVSQALPNLFAAAQRMISEENVLLCHFIPTCDLAERISGREVEYNRFFNVTVEKSNMGHLCLLSDFSKLKIDLIDYYSKLGVKVEEVFNGKVSRIVEEYGSHMKVEQAFPIGVLENSSNCLSIATITCTNANGKNLRVVSSMNLVFVKGVIVSMNNYSFFNGEKDFRWIDSTGRKWCKEIHAINSR